MRVCFLVVPRLRKIITIPIILILPFFFSSLLALFLPLLLLLRDIVLCLYFLLTTLRSLFPLKL